MGPSPQARSTRIERAVVTVLVAQHMAGASPTKADAEIARRQLSGKISADEAVTLAIAAARTPFMGPDPSQSAPSVS